MNPHLRRHPHGRRAASLLLAPAIAAATLTGAAPAQAAPVPPLYTEQDLAVNGAGGFPNYRIPALTVTPDGDLLASYDGRPTGIDAPGPNSILQRRSTDGGRTWGDQQVVSAGQTTAPIKGFSDPSYLVDRETETIFNFHVYSQKQGFSGSRPGTDPADPNVLHANVATSVDGGRTWSERTITADITPDPGWRSRFAASGEGIQLRYGPHAGRLIQQYTIINAAGAFQSVSVYSDDHGTTWRAGEAVGVGMDENKTVELSDGRVMLNSRDSARSGYRKVTISTDGGHSYGPVTVDRELPDPTNNASIIRAFPDAPADSAQAKILLFSNAANQTSRSQGTIRMSCDDGQTWPVSKVFQPGAMSYSTLTALPDGTYGLLYEPANGIRYANFNLAWLDGICANVSIPDVAIDPGQRITVPVTVTNQSGIAVPKPRLELQAPSDWQMRGSVTPLRPGHQTKGKVTIKVPRDTAPGRYPVTATLRTSVGKTSTSFTVTVGLLDQARMSIADVDSEETASEDGRARNVLDGSDATFWHTEWSRTDAPGYPHRITLDLGGAHRISGLQYTRRQNSANEQVADYEIYTSLDGTTWEAPLATGRFTTSLAPQRAVFPAVTARYVRLVALSEQTGHKYAAVAELNVEGRR
ncbi:discoidin domain-containing protein [Micromonospora sp. NBC_00858]|uniref:discoidin domain-containing protein n=1 Tax=Micromonospora sp. NBC_00858 TaxID=2975979 RepID=UPI00386FC3BA|nr:exo-alpha-sialidase [Micromonospora sp. NBC_00858]